MKVMHLRTSPIKCSQLPVSSSVNRVYCDSFSVNKTVPDIFGKINLTTHCVEHVCLELKENKNLYSQYYM